MFRGLCVSRFVFVGLCVSRFVRPCRFVCLEVRASV